MPRLNYFIKDLRKLGRPLSKTIIVDNTPQNFSLQPENGIAIKSWNGEANDTELLGLSNYLKQVRLLNVDVRLALKLQMK